MKINILGTEYTIIKKAYDAEPEFKTRSIDGYCDPLMKEIVYCDMTTFPGWEKEPKERAAIAERHILRHEITHGFFDESGLQESTFKYDGAWARNEEMIDWFALDDGDPVGQEIGWARRAALHAALEAIDGNTSPAAELLRLEYRQLLDQAESNPDGLMSSELPADPVRLQAIDAARLVLFEMRQSGEIGDDAFHRLEEEFDWAELSAAKS